MAPALHHEIDGPADAPVVVLGPSLGTDLHLFDAQVEALAPTFRVVRFDLPGHGGSPDPNRGRSTSPRSRTASSRCSTGSGSSDSTTRASRWAGRSASSSPSSTATA